MDINQIEREITWYTKEIGINERDLGRARTTVHDLESKLRTNQQKLEQFTRDLSNAEFAQKQRQSSISKKYLDFLLPAV